MGIGLFSSPIIVEFHPHKVFNSTMNRPPRHSASALRAIFIMLVFAFNAATAYGACCIELESMPTQAEASCHKTAVDSDDSERVDHSGACVACLAMASPQQVKPATANIAGAVPATLPFFTSNNPAPPFRPPITHLC